MGVGPCQLKISSEGLAIEKINRNGFCLKAPVLLIFSIENFNRFGSIIFNRNEMAVSKKHTNPGP